MQYVGSDSVTIEPYTSLLFLTNQDRRQTSRSKSKDSPYQSESNASMTGLAFKVVVVLVVLSVVCKGMLSEPSGKEMQLGSFLFFPSTILKKTAHGYALLRCYFYCKTN
jgi:hypothetical protein